MDVRDLYDDFSEVKLKALSICADFAVLSIESTYLIFGTACQWSQTGCEYGKIFLSNLLFLVLNRY